MLRESKESDRMDEKRMHEICIDLCLSYDDPFMSCENCQILRQADKARECRKIYDTKH